MPTTTEECAALREWAETTPVERRPAASRDQLARHLDFMNAALPSRATDEDTGRKRAVVYASLLAGHSNEALAFMARRACATLDWFPTPRQCLDILAEYRAPEPPQVTAIAYCREFTQRRFEQWLADVRAGEPIGDVPEHWMRIAVEQGAMRRLSDGAYVSRALYHGPTLPVAA